MPCSFARHTVFIAVVLSLSFSLAAAAPARQLAAAADRPAHGAQGVGRLETVIIAAAAVTGVVMFTAIRQQTVVGDVQFPRSMIPHHSGAI
jgi:hypothetical protein